MCQILLCFVAKVRIVSISFWHLWLSMGLYGTFWHVYGTLWPFLALLACYTVLWRIHFCCNIRTFLGQSIFFCLFLCLFINNYNKINSFNYLGGIPLKSWSMQIIAPMPEHLNTALYHCSLAVTSTSFKITITFMCILTFTKLEMHCLLLCLLTPPTILITLLQPAIIFYWLADSEIFVKNLSDFSSL